MYNLPSNLLQTSKMFPVINIKYIRECLQNFTNLIPIFKILVSFRIKQLLRSTGNIETNKSMKTHMCALRIRKNLLCYLSKYVLSPVIVRKILRYKDKVFVSLVRSIVAANVSTPFVNSTSIPSLGRSRELFPKFGRERTAGRRRSRRASWIDSFDREERFVYTRNDR